MGKPRQEGQIEITPRMIQAGADVIWRQFGDVLSYGSSTGLTVASEVFEAMVAAGPYRALGYRKADTRKTKVFQRRRDTI